MNNFLGNKYYPAPESANWKPRESRSFKGPLLSGFQDGE
jgi:hypothetical protein